MRDKITGPFLFNFLWASFERVLQRIQLLSLCEKLFRWDGVKWDFVERPQGDTMSSCLPDLGRSLILLARSFPRNDGSCAVPSKGWPSSAYRRNGSRKFIGHSRGAVESTSEKPASKRPFEISRQRKMGHLSKTCSVSTYYRNRNLFFQLFVRTLIVIRIESLNSEFLATIVAVALFENFVFRDETYSCYNSFEKQSFTNACYVSVISFVHVIVVLLLDNSYFYEI